MQENHVNEQYFFEESTLDHLARFVSKWRSPCCLSAPMIGKALAERGIDVTILDIDDRFAHLPGFIHFDITRPQWLGKDFGLIVCDPPFFNVSLLQLFTAIRMLSQHRFDQPLMISYLRRRSMAMLSAFAPFHLRETGYLPRYETVEPCPKNEIEFYSNLDPTALAALRAETYDGMATTAAS